MKEQLELIESILNSSKATKAEKVLASYCHNLIQDKDSLKTTIGLNGLEKDKLKNEINDLKNQRLNLQTSNHGLSMQIERLKGWINGQRNKEPTNDRMAEAVNMTNKDVDWSF